MLNVKVHVTILSHHGCCTNHRM